MAVDWCYFSLQMNDSDGKVFAFPDYFQFKRLLRLLWSKDVVFLNERCHQPNMEFAHFKNCQRFFAPDATSSALHMRVSFTYMH